MRTRLAGSVNPPPLPSPTITLSQSPFLCCVQIAYAKLEQLTISSNHIAATPPPAPSLPTSRPGVLRAAHGCELRPADH